MKVTVVPTRVELIMLPELQLPQVIVNVELWPTVTVDVPLKPPNVAVITIPLEEVLATALTRPDVLTVTSVLGLDQVARVVTFFVLPSSLFPVAVNCDVPPTLSDTVAGVTVTDCSFGLTKKPRQPTASAREERPANPSRSWTFRLLLGIMKAPNECGMKHQAAQFDSNRELPDRRSR